MRFLAFTDIHSNLKAVELLKKKAESYDVELLVCAGDITLFGKKTKEILEALDAIGKPIILIHGNHEDEDEVAHYVQSCKNIVFVHKDVHEYKNFVFLGYGGGGFSAREPEFAQYIKKHSHRKNVILVTHQPPHHTLLDEIDGEYVGNLDFRKFIDEQQPLVAICGHIHENQLKQDVINNTFVINPGPLGRVLELDTKQTDKKDTRKKN